MIAMFRIVTKYKNFELIKQIVKWFIGFNDGERKSKIRCLLLGNSTLKEMGFVIYIGEVMWDASGRKE